MELKIYNSSLKEANSGKAILVLPILKDRQLLKENILVSGDSVEVKVSCYEDMPEDIRQIQLSDSIEDWETTYYYVHELMKIPETELGEIAVPDNSQRVIQLPKPLQVSSIDLQAQQKRRLRIDSELRSISDKLQEHGGSFQA